MICNGWNELHSFVYYPHLIYIIAIILKLLNVTKGGFPGLEPSVHFSLAPPYYLTRTVLGRFELVVQPADS